MKRGTLVLVALALLPGGVGQVRADFIAYTWSDDGHDGLSGSFTVDAGALSAGGFTANDITAWSFTTPNATYESTIRVNPLLTNISANVFGPDNSPDMIPIDSTTGAFLADSGTASVTFIFSSGLTILGGTKFDDSLNIATDSDFSTFNSESWQETIRTTFSSLDGGRGVTTITDDTGTGSWAVQIVTESAVPEPSTLTLLGVGAVCSLGYSWRRRKWAV